MVSKANVSLYSNIVNVSATQIFASSLLGTFPLVLLSVQAAINVVAAMIIAVAIFFILDFWLIDEYGINSSFCFCEDSVFISYCIKNESFLSGIDFN